MKAIILKFYCFRRRFAKQSRADQGAKVHWLLVLSCERCSVSVGCLLFCRIPIVRNPVEVLFGFPYCYRADLRCKGKLVEIYHQSGRTSFSIKRYLNALINLNRKYSSTQKGHETIVPANTNLQFGWRSQESQFGI